MVVINILGFNSPQPGANKKEGVQMTRKERKRDSSIFRDGATEKGLIDGR